jgi:hypothetical protein
MAGRFIILSALTPLIWFKAERLVLATDRRALKPLGRNWWLNLSQPWGAKASEVEGDDFHAVAVATEGA